MKHHRALLLLAAAALSLFPLAGPAFASDGRPLPPINAQCGAWVGAYTQTPIGIGRAQSPGASVLTVANGSSARVDGGASEGGFGLAQAGTSCSSRAIYSASYATFVGCDCVGWVSGALVASASARVDLMNSTSFGQAQVQLDARYEISCAGTTSGAVMTPGVACRVGSALEANASGALGGSLGALSVRGLIGLPLEQSDTGRASDANELAIPPSPCTYFQLVLDSSASGSVLADGSVVPLAPIAKAVIRARAAVSVSGLTLSDVKGSCGTIGG